MKKGVKLARSRPISPFVTLEERGEALY